MDWDENSREVFYHDNSILIYPTPLYNHYKCALWFTITQHSNIQSHNDVMLYQTVPFMCVEWDVMRTHFNLIKSCESSGEYYAYIHAFSTIYLGGY